jgi:hypothetical protein
LPCVPRMTDGRAGPVPVAGVGATGTLRIGAAGTAGGGANRGRTAASCTTMRSGSSPGVAVKVSADPMATAATACAGLIFHGAPAARCEGVHRRVPR